jgi:hypothetical protein
MCKARNVALCAALLFSVVDVVELVWFVVSFRAVHCRNKESDGTRPRLHHYGWYTPTTFESRIAP